MSEMGILRQRFHRDAANSAAFISLPGVSQKCAANGGVSVAQVRNPEIGRAIPKNSFTLTPTGFGETMTAVLC
jgi:hypothetical protein